MSIFTRGLIVAAAAALSLTTFGAVGTGVADAAPVQSADVHAASVSKSEALKIAAKECEKFSKKYDSRNATAERVKNDAGTTVGWFVGNSRGTDPDDPWAQKACLGVVSNVTKSHTVYIIMDGKRVGTAKRTTGSYFVEKKLPVEETVVTKGKQTDPKGDGMAESDPVFFYNAD